MGFFERSRAANSAVRGTIWPNFEPILHVNLVGVLVTCKNKEDPIKKMALEWRQHFPIITIVAMDTRVLIRPCPKPNAAFPLLNEALDKIVLHTKACGQNGEFSKGYK